MSKKTSNYVSRDKYENIKNKGTQWHDECSELRDKVQKLSQMNKDLLNQNEDLLNQNEDLVDKIKDLNDSNIQEPNNVIVDELENQNKSLIKQIRNLKKDNKISEDKYRDKLINLERDLFIKDGKIQRLEDAKKDLNERYLELKEDWREERRNNKKEK